MINGKNIQLRLIQQKDLFLLYEKINDPGLRGDHLPAMLISEVQLQEMFVKTGFCNEESTRLLIVDLQDNLLGTMHFFKANTYSDAVELSFLIFSTLHRNKGYAAEAVTLICHYLFSHRRLNRIQLSMAVSNEGSRRVAEKCGFTLEGIARGSLFLAGKDVDMHIYSLLRDEWAKTAKKEMM